MKKLNVIEICAGAGGMAMGFKRAGFESLALAEINNAAVKTLHKNFAGKNIIAGDITKDDVKAEIVAAAYKSKVESLMAKNPNMNFDTLLNIAMEQGADADLLCSGIPCQSYSIMGKKEHMDCDNGMLFDHYLQLADCIRPKMLLIENVAALVTAEDSDVIEYMLAEFRKIGYYASFQENEDLYSTVKVLNAADYGVPQRRMRVFIVGIRQDIWNKAKSMGITYNFPEPTHVGKHITLREAIKDVPESKYLTYSDNVKKVLQSALPGKAANIDLFDKSLLDENGDFAISVKRFSRYRRLDFDRVCHTVAASEPNTLCHPEFDRPLNINEIKRIQSFPDDFEFCGGVAEVYKQIGNAVPVLLAQAVATSIAEFLNAVVVEETHATTNVAPVVYKAASAMDIVSATQDNSSDVLSVMCCVDSSVGDSDRSDRVNVKEHRLVNAVTSKVDASLAGMVRLVKNSGIRLIQLVVWLLKALGCGSGYVAKVLYRSLGVVVSYVVVVWASSVIMLVGCPRAP